MNEEIADTGHISSSSMESFSKTIKDINDKLGGLKISTKSATDFLYEENGAIKLNNDSLSDYIDELIQAMMEQKLLGESINEDLFLQLKLLKQEFKETKKEIEETYNEKIQSAYEEWQEALDTVREKQEAVAEAEQEVIEKEEELIEKQEELQKLYYGEENHKNQNDYLYNYNTELE